MSATKHPVVTGPGTEKVIEAGLSAAVAYAVATAGRLGKTDQTWYVRDTDGIVRYRATKHADGSATVLAVPRADR